nr:hypothetical protein [Tanacetum cinerariifolium]
MMVQAPKDMGEGLEIPNDPHHTPIVTQPSSSPPRRSKNQKGNKGNKLKFLHQVVRFLMRKVLDLEEAKTTQAMEIASLKKRVKKLEHKRKLRTSGLKRLRKGRMNEEDMFGVNDLDSDEVVMDVLASDKVEQSVKIIKKEVSTADPVTTADEVVTIADKDKGKGKMIKPERPLKRKDQIMMDEEVARNLEAHMQAKLEEEERLARLKEEETNIALVVEWDNTQAMIDVYFKLATRLQEEERGELSIEEKSRLFVELMDKRKKHFARLRAEKIRSKPPTKAQKRNQMSTYLKNMANYKHNQLKNKSFKEIQMLFNNTMKWIEAFVPMDTELVKGSDKAIEGSEKAKEELKRCMEIIPDDDDVTIKATPLSSNLQPLEDLEVLWSIVKARFKKTKPIDDMDNLLFQTLKTMFEDHVANNIWKYQQGTVKVLHWKLFDSCGLYCVTTQNMVYYLLVEKVYPFTRKFPLQMWNDVRLQLDYEVEMEYDLLILIRRQINEGYGRIVGIKRLHDDVRVTIAQGSTTFILKLLGLYGLMGGSVPLLSPRFISKNGRLGSTSIEIPLVSSTSSGSLLRSSSQKFDAFGHFSKATTSTAIATAAATPRTTTTADYTTTGTTTTSTAAVTPPRSHHHPTVHATAATTAATAAAFPAAAAAVAGCGRKHGHHRRGGGRNRLKTLRLTLMRSLRRDAGISSGIDPRVPM